MLKVHVHDKITDSVKIVVVSSPEEAIATENRYNLEMGDNFWSFTEAE